MCETPNMYFEPYRHVLKAIQRIDPENFPFEKYFINCETDVSPPKYLKSNPTIDMSPAFTEKVFFFFFFSNFYLYSFFFFFLFFKKN